MVHLKHAHTFTQSAVIASLQVNPIYNANGTLITIKVIALDIKGKAVPSWAQPQKRRAPTKQELAAIVATPMLPGEIVFPTWIERASQPYLQTVYGDLINATTPIVANT